MGQDEKPILPVLRAKVAGTAAPNTRKARKTGGSFAQSLPVRTADLAGPQALEPGSARYVPIDQQTSDGYADQAKLPVPEPDIAGPVPATPASSREDGS
ncbi:hypothetical protein [uncultured Jatrophihabitans sp.]|uniref:hypothetical protein n=1 Tax=uncultured Jatrophihabitans sp. TaxID=1610747 RepID=UPI0035CBB3C8